MNDRTDELEEQIDDLDDRREVVESDLREADKKRSEAIESIDTGSEDAIERVKDAQEQYDKIERELEAIDQERQALTAKLREKEVSEESADRIERLGNIAREAVHARDEMFALLEETDEQLAEQIRALREKEEAWKRAVHQFTETFQNVAPGLSEVELRRAEEPRRSELQRERDEILSQLEEQGVDVSAALDRGYTRRGVTQTYTNPWPDTEYGWVLNEAMSRGQSPPHR